MDAAPILDPMPGGLLQPAYPLNAGELTRLLTALEAARKCGADAGAFAGLPAEAQALLLRLDIKPRTGPESLADLAAPVRVVSRAEAEELWPPAAPTSDVRAAPVPAVVDPNRPRSCASF